MSILNKPHLIIVMIPFRRFVLHWQVGRIVVLNQEISNHIGPMKTGILLVSLIEHWQVSMLILRGAPSSILFIVSLNLLAQKLKSNILVGFL